MSKLTINALSELTGIDRRTIKKRLEPITEPGASAFDPKQALPLICAVASQKSTGPVPRILESQARYEAAHAEREEMKRDKEARELLPASLVASVWTAVLVTLRQKILHLDKISDEDKREILLDLQDIPIDEYFEQPLSSEEEADLETGGSPA